MFYFRLLLSFPLFFPLFFSSSVAVPIPLPPARTTSLKCQNHTPIVVLHGILSAASKLNIFSDWLEATFQTQVFNIEIGNGEETSLFVPMKNQLHELCETIYAIDELREGFHFIGMSQGGLLARGYVEQCNQYPVLNLITLVSPHGGVVETTDVNMYGPIIQKHVSFSNYWRDPENIPTYLLNCSYLPLLNNEIYSHLSFIQKENMKTLENIVLVWSPYDNILNPPESAKFSFYDEEYNIIPIEQTALYEEDRLGLKFLDQNNKLHIHNTTCSHGEHRDPICFEQLYDIFKLYLS